MIGEVERVVEVVGREADDVGTVLFMLGEGAGKLARDCGVFGGVDDMVGLRGLVGGSV